MMQGTGAYLIAAAVGFLVLERAEKHKGALQRIGRVVGVIIIAASLLTVICSFAYGWKACPFGGKRMGGYCPLTSKMAPAMPGQ